MKTTETKKSIKREIGKPIAFIAIAVVVIAMAWIGWYYSETPENRGLNEEAIFRAAEAKAKSNHVDLRTAPGAWPGLYYKYHPEEKPGTPSASAAPSISQPPAPSQTGAPSGQ